MSKKSCLLVIFASLTVVCGPSFAEKPRPAKASIARGKYLAVIAGCNDCHTKGWLETEARIPEKEWLAGNVTGWSGPWGTTYAPNLRLFIANFTEDSWLRFAHKLRVKPPMPWWSLHTMNEADLGSIYRLKPWSHGSSVTALPSARPKAQAPLFPFRAGDKMIRTISISA